MKHLFLIIFSVLCLSNVQAQSYSIKVEISDLPNQQIRLGHYSGPDFFVVDSAMTNNSGKAVFQGTKKLAHGVYFIVMPSSSHFDFLIADKQNLSIKTKQFSALESLVITGDVQNKGFIDFQRKIAKLNITKRELAIEKRVYQNLPDSLAAVVKREKIIEQQRVNLYDSISSLYSGSLLADLIQAMIPVELPVAVKMWRSSDPPKYFEYYTQHFFDNVNFKEEGVFNSPQHIFHNALVTFSNYFLNPRVDKTLELRKVFDGLMQKAATNQTAQKYVVGFIVDTYEYPKVIGMDELYVYLAREYVEKNKFAWMSKEFAQEISRRADLIEPNLVGKMSADLKFPDRNGEMHSLHEFDNRYTVVWFYETDCDICTKRTPMLSKVYADLQVMNIDLIAVNIDANKQEWESFIDKHKFPFLNLYNPMRNPDLLYAYGLNKTPRLFILNAEKQIVAKDVSIAHLLNYIAYLDENSQALKNKYIFTSPVMDRN